MSTTNINIRIDADLKKSAEELFADLGLTMTSAITMFLRTAVNSNGIPFELKRKETAFAPATAEAEDTSGDAGKVHSSPSAYKSYSSARDMINDILGSQK